MSFMPFEGPGFMMEIPTNWLITSSTQFQVMFIAPSDNSIIRTNLMVTIRPANPDLTVATLMAETRQIQEREYDQYTILQEIDYTKSGGIGYLRHYRWHEPDKNTDVIQVQQCFLVSHAVFTLTSTRIADDITHEVTLTHIMESFRLTKPIK